MTQTLTKRALGTPRRGQAAGRIDAARPAPDLRRSTIQQLSNRRRSQVVRRVCEKLQATYGLPRHGNPTEPLDDMIYIVLSNKTGPIVARRTFEALRVCCQANWENLLQMPLADIQELLRPAGLARVKALQIRSALGQIARDFGQCDLTPLRQMVIAEAHTYLVGLPGISDKVAKCVLLYTMNAPVLPVDAHVHRIATRLGWTTRKRPDQCHDELEALVPPARRYAFHVDCVAHGRVCCRPLNPDCGACCVKHHCEFRRRNG